MSDMKELYLSSQLPELPSANDNERGQLFKANCVNH
ncbi:hypothetical protein EV207_11513 [Scopulibacillus darangshiensis]|uniref:Uncharacterized protein n=1 Tax=Scopulibacillus darangshiensis TaxID=442528 RepID=A0A4R2P3S9_9BACL|nr:hypothetical protein EV207_11513 [Scopulibacillus darangshiensis]